jgi:hypothetical protein
MSPSPPTQDHRDRCSVDGEFISDTLMGKSLRPTKTYVGDVLISKPRMVVQSSPLGSANTSASPLRIHINHVVGLCSDEEMRGPHARRIVAIMKEEHARWDWSHDVFVGNTVSTLDPDSVPGQPVASVIGRAHPLPTPFACLDLGPEAFFLKHEVILS